MVNLLEADVVLTFASMRVMGKSCMGFFERLP